MPGEPWDANKQQFFDRVLARIPAAATRSSVTIIAVQNERFHQHGTGTLFRVADDHFLVTAAHVLADARKGHAELLLGPAHGTTTGLNGHSFYSKRRSKIFDDDLLDVALVRLDQQVVGHLRGDGCEFLGLGNVSLSDKLGPDFYLALGFPTEWMPSKPVGGDEPLQGTALKYLMTLFDGDTGNLGNFDPEFHLLLNADPDLRVGPGGSAPDPLGRVNGVSGASIWRLDIHNPDGEAKIVALQTSWYDRPPIIKGTFWWHVAWAIGERIPKHRPVIQSYGRFGDLAVRRK